MFTKRISESLTEFDRNDEEFVRKQGKRKAFFTGGNSSCRHHIRQHYLIYQKKCKDGNIPEHHWAIPRAIWKIMEDEKNGKKVVTQGTQGTLDGLLIANVAPVVPVFTRENLLHMVTQFVAVDDQVRPVRS
jgi:hypothetical protein